MVTNNDVMLDHLADKQKTVHQAVTSVNEHIRNGGKYTRAGDAALITSVKALDPSCAVCAAWDGSAAPDQDV
jgi:hypothetical protein